MKNLIITLLISFIFISMTEAKEKSRPKSIGGDYVAEVNFGVVFEESEDVFELGFDFESFIKETHHHFSIGVATEIEFKEEETEYFLGPLLSAYFYHFKFFITSGILTNFQEEHEWKSRLGLGYEIVHLKDWILVPTFTLDYVDQEFDLGVSLGFAYEF